MQGVLLKSSLSSSSGNNDALLLLLSLSLFGDLLVDEQRSSLLLLLPRSQSQSILRSKDLSIPVGSEDDVVAEDRGVCQRKEEGEGKGDR